MVNRFEWRSRELARNSIPVTAPTTGAATRRYTTLRGTTLQDTALPDILENCPRPLLVVEDGPHSYEGSLAALTFFDRYLISGDYIVIEDGILRDLGYRAFKNGPNRAINDFLRSNEHRYQVNRDYCDFYGHNVTWNTNGYLKRL